MENFLISLTQPFSADVIYGWEEFLGDWFFAISIIFLLVELAIYAAKKHLKKGLLADTATNFATLAMYIGISYLFLAAFYLSAYSYVHQFAIFEIEISWATVAICVVLADLAYYWEHRFMHRVNLAWATHAVHHSSPHFNISVAYRFGPMDGVWPIFFSLPLVLLGFDPFMVFFSELFVQLFQTMLHTEVVKKFPRPIEAVFNTPSHHRVHHGSNIKYLDSNYAGVFIVWDRMFGTFVEEDEKVVYGLTRPVNTNNPIKVFFLGFARIFKSASTIDGLFNKLRYFISPPGWRPK